METTNKKNVEPMVKKLDLQIGFSESVSDEDKQMVKETIRNNLLGKFATKLVYDNLTVEELEIAEQIAKNFVESRRDEFEHEWCYRVWVKSFYEGENADRVEEKFGTYERVFTEKSDADEYMEKVKFDLYELGYYPFESAYRFYNCAVMQSTLLLNWNDVKYW